MRRERLKRQFFNRPTLVVARDLLGKYIARRLEKGEVKIGKIIETEAYIGPKDKASHAVNGKMTERNQAEWLTGGHVYIYLVYGMYWQLNFSTAGPGKPECVLIRGLDVADDLPKDIASGPGKLCRYLELDKSFYGADAAKDGRLRLEDRGEIVAPKDIEATARVGIDYAGPYWSAKKWRFVLKNSRAKIKL
ncbi:MAG: DNA-3-methyladenine glycosylase [bacterium]|nr:DNA-3-methyladenine glycosylase [bacterium]